MAGSLRLKERSESDLIAAARAGDGPAFDELVRRYQDTLYRLMVRACHHPQDAEEVAVEAFARAYQRLGQFEGRSAFITWLGRIATNLCFRRRERAEPLSVPLDERDRQRENGVDHFPAAGSDAPERETLRQETRRIVRAAIAELPEPDQTVLRLRDIELLPAAEVSAHTGLTVPAVKARLHRARARLRERLNDTFLGDTPTRR